MAVCQEPTGRASGPTALRSFRISWQLSGALAYV